MDGDPDTQPRRTDRIPRLIAAVGLAGLIALTGLTVADVLLRWLFSAPIDGAGEIGKLLIAVVVASFFPSALAERQHIVIDFAAKALGPRIDRGLTVFADAVTLVFFAAVAWRFVLYAAELAGSGETTWILGWPVAPWWMVATAFVIVCVPVQAIVLYQVVRRPGRPATPDDAASGGGAA